MPINLQYFLNPGFLAVTCFVVLPMLFFAIGALLSATAKIRNLLTLLTLLFLFIFWNLPAITKTLETLFDKVTR